MSKVSISLNNDADSEPDTKGNWDYPFALIRKFTLYMEIQCSKQNWSLPVENCNVLLVLSFGVFGIFKNIYIYITYKFGR